MKESTRKGVTGESRGGRSQEREKGWTVNLKKKGNGGDKTGREQTMVIKLSMSS